MLTKKICSDIIKDKKKICAQLYKDFAGVVSIRFVQKISKHERKEHKYDRKSNDELVRHSKMHKAEIDEEDDDADEQETDIANLNERRNLSKQKIRQAEYPLPNTVSNKRSELTIILMVKTNKD
jgi:hypothetical protein